VGGESVSRAVDFQPVLFSAQCQVHNFLHHAEQLTSSFRGCRFAVGGSWPLPSVAGSALKFMSRQYRVEIRETGTRH